MTIKRWNSSSSTWVQVGIPSSAIASSTIVSKGDIIVGTGSAAYTNLPVGGRLQELIPDSTQTSGMRWGNDAQIMTIMGANI